jgi:hypothetical protein
LKQANAEYLPQREEFLITARALAQAPARNRIGDVSATSHENQEQDFADEYSFIFI